MMKTTALILALLTGMGATAALAMETSVEDANGDGVYSKEELIAAFPELSDENFEMIDANGDGQVDTAELESAEEEGWLPADS